MGCLLGGAVGTHPVPSPTTPHMSRPTLDARPSPPRRRGEPEDIPGQVHRAYLRWMHAHGEPVPPRLVSGWLVSHTEFSPAARATRVSPRCAHSAAAR